MYQLSMFTTDEIEWLDDFDESKWHPGWAEALAANEEDLVWDDEVEENI